MSLVRAAARTGLIDTGADREAGPIERLFPVSNPGVALSSILAHHARRSPSRTALILGDDAVGYDALDTSSNRRARQMAAQGVGQGDFVTVALPNGLEFYETVFAIWKLGAIPNIVS